MNTKQNEIIKALKEIATNQSKGKKNSLEKLRKIQQKIEKANDNSSAPQRGREFTIHGVFSGEFNNDSCSLVDLPYIAPRFKLEWGDGPTDQIETHDNEVLHISACNTYQNIVFKGLKIKNIFVWGNSTLPNGEPSVQIHTSAGVCYGDIAPCTCVDRDFMLTVQNETPGLHYIIIEFDIDAIELVNNVFPYELFPVNLINS